MSGVPRLLMLHGFLSGSACWDPLRRHLEGAVDTIAPDFPGYGGRPGPRRVTDYTIDALLSDLEPVLEREQPTHVLGHSMGGIVALALAARYPGRFQGVGVVGLPVYQDRADALEYLNRQGLLRRAFLYSDRLAHGACRAMYATRWTWAPFTAWVAPRHPRSYLQSAFRHSTASHVGSLARIVFAGHVPNLACAAGPGVAALHGTRDRAAPLDRAATLAEEHRWDFTVVDGAGHQVIVDRPRLTARWVRNRLLCPPLA